MPPDAPIAKNDNRKDNNQNIVGKNNNNIQNFVTQDPNILTTHSNFNKLSENVSENDNSFLLIVGVIVLIVIILTILVVGFIVIILK